MNKPRVLIVEDQLIVAEDMARVLEESGYEVIGINNTGEEAVKTALQGSPDLVPVDIRLRGAMDGIEAAQVIRTHADPAIVFLTAHSEKGLFERAKETAPDGYLHKPVSPTELSRTVEIVLFKHSMEKRLRESEGKYRELVDTISDGIVQIDTVGTVTFANPAYCRMLGFRMEEIIGKSILDFQVSESERKELRAYVEYVVSQQTPPVPWVGTHQTNDGGLIVVQCDWNYRRDNQGNVIGFIAVVKDITERKRIEEAAEIEKKRFEALAENSPFGLVMIDLDGTFQYFNPKFREMFGYSLEEVPSGRKWFRVAFPEPNLRKEAISMWVRDLREARLGKQRARIFTVKCKDGGEKVINFRPVQLPSGSHLMTCEDITDRWKTEERLRESEEEFRRIVENLQDAFYRADMNGVFTFLSPASERVAGYKPEEGVGRPITMFYADPTERQEFMKLMMENGFVNDFQARLVHKDGHIVWVSTSARLYKDKDGGIAGVEGIARDISDRKKADEALRTSEERNRFLANVIQSSSQPFAVSRMDDGDLMIANKAYCNLVGYTEEEILHSDGPKGLTPPEYRELESSKLAELRTSGNPARYEKEYIRKDGTRVPVDLFVHTATDEKGEACYYAFVTDLTERKDAEQKLTNAYADLEQRVLDRTAQLKQANEKLFSEVEERKRVEKELIAGSREIEDLYNNAPCGYHSLDANGVYVRINDTELSWLGYTREEIVGKKRFQDLITAKGLQTFHKDFRLFLERGSTSGLEYDMISKRRHDIAGASKGDQRERLVRQFHHEPGHDV